MASHKYLGAFEQMLLLAAMRLGDDAYGVRIVEEIRARSGRNVTRGSLYVTFDRLEAKGLIASSYRDSSDDRGGRRRRYIIVTEGGRLALREARSDLQGLGEGLEAELDGTA